MSECPGRYALASFVCNDMKADEQARIQAHIADCTACQKSIASLQENIVRFEDRREQHWNKLKTRLAEESQRKSFSLGWLRPWAVAASVAVLAVLVIWGVWPREIPGSSEGTVAYKGIFSAQIVARRDGQQFFVEPNAALQPDDALRFVVTTATPGYLCIASLDETGKLFPYYPNTDPQVGPNPVSIKKAGRHELAGSIVLDEFTGREWLVILFSPDWFSPSETFNRLQSAYKKSGPGGLTQSSLAFSGEVIVVPIQKVKKS